MSILDCAFIAVLERSRHSGALDQRFETLLCERRRAFSFCWRRFSPVPFRSPRRHGLAVASSGCTSCDHGLPFITTQWPVSSGDTAFRGLGPRKTRIGTGRRRD